MVTRTGSDRKINQRQCTSARWGSKLEQRYGELAGPAISSGTMRRIMFLHYLKMVGKHREMAQVWVHLQHMPNDLSPIPRTHIRSWIMQHWQSQHSYGKMGNETSARWKVENSSWKSPSDLHRHTVTSTHPLVSQPVNHWINQSINQSVTLKLKRNILGLFEEFDQ